MESPLFGLKVFSELIRKHPIRFVIGGVALAIWFHIFRFWAAQAGIFANTQLPTSIFAPSYGWNMIVGPIIEVTKDIDPNDCWKKIVFFILLAFSILTAALRLTVKQKDLKKYVTTAEQYLRVGIFVFVPALVLPKSQLGVGVDIVSTIAVMALILTFGGRFRKLQSLTLLIALGCSYFTISEYFQRGKRFVSECQLQAALKTEGEVITGCWITSSEKYIVLKSNGKNNLVIPREDVLNFSFTPKGGNHL